MGRLRSIRWSMLCGLLLAIGARAEERYDHVGALGLLLEGGLEFRDRATSGAGAESGLQLPVGLGGTWAIGYNGNELKLIARLGLANPAVDVFADLGYRGYFGRERFKTFVDLDLEAHAAPFLYLGPRIGFGVQYELASTVGLYAVGGGKIGLGQGVRFGAELVAGVQLRSYLLE